MKILITGAKGFIGKNLVAELESKKKHEIYQYDIDSSLSDLDFYTKNCDFVFHLAGVNRPEKQEEFMEGNFGFTSTLLSFLVKHHNKAPFMLSSSVQAELDNPYGISKKAGEELLIDYGRKQNVPIHIYRFPNVFGKWCRPNYNSVVATFCHLITHDQPIQISNPLNELDLLYIDDLINEMVDLLNHQKDDNNYPIIKPTYQITLGKIAELLYEFKNSRTNRSIPDTKDLFTKKLYATYLSYLPTDQFSYELKMNSDQRGSFTEFIKTINQGQISINISKKGIVKGNHWHHTKNEKFLVVSGSGVIRFRKIDSDKVIEYFVSDEKLEVVDIPPGYTHNIENLGETDMVTVMWANEMFDPKNPDTIYLEV